MIRNTRITMAIRPNDGIWTMCHAYVGSARCHMLPDVILENKPDSGDKGYCKRHGVQFYTDRINLALETREKKGAAIW